MGRRIQSLDELRRPPATLPAGLRTTAKAGALPVRILGVDPGSRVTGWGLIEARGAKLSHIAHGCIKTGDGELPERLLAIHRGLQGAIVEHLPTEIAVEEVFVRINIASSLVLGQARGIALLAGAQAGLAFAEYAPAQITRALVGSGRAEKAQIQHMVRLLLGLSGALAADAADALAIAICHAHVRGTLGQGREALKGRWG